MQTSNTFVVTSFSANPIPRYAQAVSTDSRHRTTTQTINAEMHRTLRCYTAFSVDVTSHLSITSGQIPRVTSFDLSAARVQVGKSICRCNFDSGKFQSAAPSKHRAAKIPFRQSHATGVYPLKKKKQKHERFESQGHKRRPFAYREMQTLYLLQNGDGMVPESSLNPIFFQVYLSSK